MADLRKVVLVVHQTVEHRVEDEVDLDEVRAWLAPRVFGRPEEIEIGSQHLVGFLESRPGWKDAIPHLLVDSTKQEPYGEELVEVVLGEQTDDPSPGHDKEQEER